MMQHELQRRTARRIKVMRGLHNKISTTQVSVQVGTATKILYEPKEIEDACIQANIAKFSFANHSPATQNEVIRAIGWRGEGPCTTAVLQGTFQPPEHWDEGLQRVLKELAFPSTQSNYTSTIPINPKVSSEDNKKAW